MNNYEDIFLIIQEAYYNLHWIETAAVVTGIIYIFLAAREQVLCWPFGIVSALLWSYAAFDFYDLYIDAILQLYYVGAGVYGWVQWNKKAISEGTSVHTISIQTHLYSIVLGLLFTFLFGFLFEQYTSAAATYLDAFTTIFSLYATYLVTQKILENWLYWIVIDAVYIYLYASRGGFLFAFLNLIFVLVAIVGFVRWLDTYRNQKQGFIKNG